MDWLVVIPVIVGVLTLLWAVFAKVIPGLRCQWSVSVQIADLAVQLRRELEATCEDWPNAPSTLEDFVGWSGSFQRGYGITEPRLESMVKLRSDARRACRHLVGDARDFYYRAANIVNPLYKKHGISIQINERAEIEQQLRSAFAAFIQCIQALDRIIEKWNQ